MYGNYSHFMKFPTGFGGKCFSVCTVRGDGEEMGEHGLLWNHLCLHARTVCFRARSCVHAWVHKTGTDRCGRG